MVLRLCHPWRRLAAAAAGLGLLFASSCTAPGPLVTVVPATPAPGPAAATALATAPVATPRPSGPTRTPQPQPTSVDQVPIDINGRYTRVTITPRHVARILATDAPVQILVHYPGPLENVEPDVSIVQPSTVKWSIEIDQPPDANTFAFSLLGYDPGLMSFEIKSSGRYATVRFALSASTPGAGTPGIEATPQITGTTATPSASAAATGTPAPQATASSSGGSGVIVGTALPSVGTVAAVPGTQGGSPAPAGARSITLADNGTRVTLRPGERFSLSLGEGYDWTVTPADPTVLSRVVNVLAIRGSQGLYEALRSGDTQLTATGDPSCRKAQPPCMMASRQFQVQIVVQ